MFFILCLDEIWNTFRLLQTTAAQNKKRGAHAVCFLCCVWMSLCLWCVALLDEIHVQSLHNIAIFVHFHRIKPVSVKK